MVAAASGLRVALVDFDLRQPGIGDILGIPEGSRAQAAHIARAASKLVEIDSVPGLSVLAFRDEPLTSLGLEMGLRGAPRYSTSSAGWSTSSSSTRRRWARSATRCGWSARPTTC